MLTVQQLFALIEQGNIKKIKEGIRKYLILKEKNPTTINVFDTPDLEGRLPLHYACQLGKADVVACFMEYKDVVDCKRVDVSNNTALKIAKKTNNTALINLLKPIRLLENTLLENTLLENTLLENTIQLPHELTKIISDYLDPKAKQRLALVNKNSYLRCLFEPEYLNVLSELLVQKPEKKWRYWFDGCQVFRSPAGHMIQHAGHMIQHKVPGNGKGFYNNQLLGELKQKNITQTELINFALSDDIYLQLLAYKIITLQDLAAIPAAKQKFFQSRVIASIMLHGYLTLDTLKKLPDDHLAVFNSDACRYLSKNNLLLVIKMSYAQAKRLKQPYLWSLMLLEEFGVARSINRPMTEEQLQGILQWPVQPNNLLEDTLNWCKDMHMPVLRPHASESEWLLTPQLAQMIFEISQQNPTVLNGSSHKTLSYIFQGLKYGCFSTSEIVKTTAKQRSYIALFMQHAIPLEKIKNLLACNEKELDLLGMGIKQNPQYLIQLCSDEKICIIDVINQQLQASAASAQPKTIGRSPAPQ